jgi:hypothetical protein
MPTKGGSADLRVIDRWDGGLGWLAYPDEGMVRASHAVVGADGGVWVLDPVDAPGVDDLLADLGEVAGVAVCLDRHRRDSAAVAARHGVAAWVPRRMDGVAADLAGECEVARFGRELGDSGFRSVRVRDSAIPPWHEVGLIDDAGTCYVPEAVGTAPYYLGGDERLGVHPMLRLTPPRRALGELRPERLLVGHGEGVATDATAALRDALDGARRRLPAAYARAARSFLA